MDLKDRKRILNLPRYDLGVSSLSFTTGLPSTGAVPQLPDEKMGLLKMLNSMLKSGQFISNGNGGLEAVTKAAPKSGAGVFLKNNAGGIANAAMSAIDFVGTIGDISKNKISSNEMMGSGGTSLENENGIGYTKERIDEAGIQRLIDATAGAATMSGIKSGGSLGAAAGSLFGPAGGAIGGVAGSIIGGVAGLFGGGKAKEEAERLLRIARNRTQDANSQRRDVAYTIGLRNQFNRENKTDTSQSLFHAALGVEDIERDVDPRKMQTKHKHLADTAEHGVVQDYVNGLGNFGETMISGKADKDGMHKVHRIKRGPNDTAPMSLKKRDTVGSRRFIDYETGLPIADAIYLNAMAHGGKISTEDKKRYEMNLKVEKMMMYTGKRKMNTNSGYLGGTLKKFDSGSENITDIWNKEADTLANNWYLPTSTNNLPKSAPVIASMPQVSTNTTTATNTGTSGSKTPGFLSKLWGGIKNAGNGLDLGNLALLGNDYMTAAQRDARAEGGLRAPKSFVANPYEKIALDELNKLHSDYYTVWAGNREAEAGAKNTIAQSGGLSAGQRMLGYMGLANRTQQNNAAALFEHQGRENALRAQAANAALQAGNLSATRQQQAYQWDEDMLAKANAARLNMWETSAYDRQNALTQYFKNRWEKNQFDRTMNLYESQLEIDKAATKAMIDSLKSNNTNGSKTTTTKPTLADVAKSVTTPAGRASLGAAQLPQLPQLPEIPTVAPKVKGARVEKTPTRKKTTSKKIALTKDSMGQQFANFVATPQKKNKPVTTKAEEKKSAKPVEKYTPIPFGNAALQERFPDASEEAKKDRPFKERAGRPAATTNSELRRRAVEWFILGKKRYEDKYGKD